MPVWRQRSELKLAAALIIICVGERDSLFAAASAFSITSVSRPSGGKAVIQWTAETNTFGNLFFTVEGASSLNSLFNPISAQIPEGSAMMFTDTTAVASMGYYRIATTPAFTSLSQSGGFSAYAATNVNGLLTSGYAGAIFDGRYVYFVPYQNSGGAHGKVLRLDTQGTFSNSSSWSAYDATAAVGSGAVGFTGGAFDGQYVYFAQEAIVSNGGELRYDTQGNFTNASSWSLYNPAITDGLVCAGFQGAGYDNRYVYFVPHYKTNATPGGWNGIVLRYDTHGQYTNSSSWHAYDAGNTSGLNSKGYSSAVFDGQYMYFIPIVNGVQTNGSGIVLRYNTQGTFTNSSSWQAYDAGNTDGLISTSYKGAVFDGRYLFFSPYPNKSNCVVLRYDTTRALTNSPSWTAYSATNTSGMQTDGYDGAVFDGRYVFFTPYHTAGNLFHGRVMRYDTVGGFTNAASWQAFDAGGSSGLASQGYVGAVSDGRYIYFAPYVNTNGFSGVVLRFDALLPRRVPATVYGGSNM
jgi:hypothetical protein